ncbi:MAG: bifunctional 2-C-methyl-D-erythritol 4-phosphate cytidylyltransferase/2-C-methyl-D-erythritol 2,4-cyclodiphosphate synthase [Sphingobium sp.]|nr:bifunctional 2-C-methyl-D-erythritol 4-phosphate cytidylyltransferase/2-C-methyl-D-erythritol 2,4-cyclodiphosphate synthase [Sphingobium sp.]
MRPAMSTAPRLTAIVLAAGSGSRSGASAPKQYRLLGGKSVLAHSVGAFLAHPRVDDVLLVVAADGEADARSALGALADKVRFTTGGAARRDSVGKALAILAGDAGPPSHVLVHDSARPGLPAEVIDRLVAALDGGAVAGMPVLPVVDTLIGSDGTVVDRSALRRVQTPQAFAFDALRAAHLAWTALDEPTDDAQMVRAIGHDVVLVDGDARLEKITLPGDHERMERLLSQNLITRIGMGFDVHRLEDGEELWLGGISIPHSHGLSGHSDADVAIHALVDAILGALGEGDIGSHFPPSDPQWRGASSDKFLAFAADRVAARGGIIDHTDLTIICEAPKIGPHRDAMRARLAEVMGVEIGQVSVKATTTERLGLTGRREGIAAQAVATIRLPGNR